MADEVETNGGAEQSVAESQLNEAEVLKSRGLFKPGLVENFDQLAKHQKGMETKFVDQDQRIEGLTKSLSRRNMEEAVKPDDDAGETQDSSPMLALVENTLAIKRMQYGKSFIDRESTIAEIIKSEPYKTMARRNLSQAIDDVFLMLEGRQSYTDRLNTSAAEEAEGESELKERRKNAARLEPGSKAKETQPAMSQIEKVEREIQKADNYFNSTGGNFAEFEKQYKMSYAKYVNGRLEEKARLLNEMKSEGG